MWSLLVYLARLGTSDFTVCSEGNSSAATERARFSGGVGVSDHPSTMSDSPGSNPTTKTTGRQPGNERWRRLFPYDEPYDNQAAAINEIQDVFLDGGYVIMEAACGTGKTDIGLLSALDLIRDSSTPFDSALCLTSVHQQLRAFEDDLKDINAHLQTGTIETENGNIESPVSGLTLVGKPDVCSYTATGTIAEEKLYNRCEDLRIPVRNAMAGKSKAEKETVLRNLVEQAEASEYDEPVATEEWTSPHAEGFPEIDEDEYCGFYARSRLDTLFTDDGYEPNGVLTPDELRKQASSVGLCPHAVMTSAIDNAEIVIGNYQHIFNPRTVQAMTGALMDESTLVICDEAHSLVESVKDELGDKITHFTLDRAIDEIEYEVLDQRRQGVNDLIWSALDSQDVEKHHVESYLAFLKRLRERLLHGSQKAIEESDAAAKFRETGHADLPSTPSKALREPDSPGQTDWLTNWIVENGDRGILEKSRSIGTAIGTALATANENHPDYTRLETYSDSVGESLARWEACGHVRYFREVELEKRDEPYGGADNDLVRHYSTQFTLHNCIPTDEIANRFERFGGGLFMSATLAPLEAFRETTGLDHLKERGRPMRELTYGLPFPRENRESLVVDLSAFTKRNRGPIGKQNALRKRYVLAAATVVQKTDGNVLIGMPKYAEAEWMAESLREWTDRTVLCDTSSSTAVTDALKEDFFAGPPKVAVTSMRGTITEGVDYSGDRLAACVVCGIPLTPIGGNLPDATKAAYGHIFGGDVAFDYAFSVPAIRKARQTWGRVIRGQDERGVRVVIDERYTEDARHSSRQYLPAYEDREFKTCSNEELGPRLEQFWA